MQMATEHDSVDAAQRVNPAVGEHALDNRIWINAMLQKKRACRHCRDVLHLIREIRMFLANEQMPDDSSRYKKHKVKVGNHRAIGVGQKFRRNFQ